MKKKSTLLIMTVLTIILLFTTSVIKTKENKKTIQTSSNSVNNTTQLSNKKIEWGIKRVENHQQPDLGAYNKKILDTYSGICLGNKEKPYVYLTFDEGYEAGYTEKILEVLKQNDVKAAFFLAGHYFNSQPELVNKMISQGHIIGNHTVSNLMSGS